MIKRFMKDTSGATAVEYAIIVGVLSFSIIGGLNAVSSSLNFSWGNTNSAIGSALGSG